MSENITPIEWETVAHWIDSSGEYSIDLNPERTLMRTRYGAYSEPSGVQRITRAPEYDNAAEGESLTYQTTNFATGEYITDAAYPVVINGLGYLAHDN